VTARPESAIVLPASHVAEVLQSLVKALRAFQMYLPNNPVYQRAIMNARTGFAPIWAATDELVLQVAETDFIWEEQVVYHQLTKSESLAWTLYKDGMRALTLRKGCEEHDIVRFLETVNRARFLPADAGDDLLTLLWEQEFVSIAYQFTEAFGEEGLPEAEGSVPPADAGTRVREEAPPRPKGVVDIDDFDSTLYFLDEAEIQYVVQEVREEYRRDVRGASLNALYDLFEGQTDPEIRSEIIGILDQLFPNLLNAGEFRAVAGVLRETRAMIEKARELRPEDRERLQSFVSSLSQPDIVRQLLQSLDEASTLPGDADVSEVLRELRPTALETLVVSLPTLASAPVRQLVEAAVDRLAAGHPSEVLRLLRESDPQAVAGIVALCGRLQMQPAVPGLGEALSHASAAVRLASVTALAQIGSAGALTHLERAVDDEDRAVRLAAVRAAGARGFKGALKRVEAVVLGKSARELDLTEKMAFFEAFGSIAGAAGLEPLGGILLPRALLRFRSSAETRACAAIALGRIRSPEARALLQRAADDKELVVRNAVSRALRGGQE
jgi:HEAT repeats